MERNIFEKQRELNDRLNRYRDEYYKPTWCCAR